MNSCINTTYFSGPDEIYPKDFENCEKFFRIAYNVLGVCMAIMANSFFFLYVNELGLILSTMMSIVVKPSGIVIVVLLIIFYVQYITLFGLTFLKWAPFIGMFLLLNNTYLVVIKKLTLPFSSTADLSPTHATLSENIQTYNAIRMLIEIYNQFLSLVTISQKFIIILICSSGFAMCIIVKSAPIFNLFLSIFCCLLLVILITEFSLAAKIYEDSVKFMETLKWHCQTRNTLELKNVRMKQRALRPLRIEAGGQYFIDAGVVLKILDAVVQNTISISLSLG